MKQYKKCPKCHTRKLVDKFGKCSKNKDGLSSWCKKCKCKSNKKHYKNNPEYYKNYSKIYYKTNKIKVAPRHNKRYQKLVAEDPEYNKKKYEKQKDYQKEYLYNYERVKRLEDENFRLAKALRSRLNAFIKGSKSKTTEKLIGCTQEEFHVYIESLFKPGMTWQNHGVNGWVIDHYWPVSEFDLTDAQQVLACFNFRNLQPLWYEENKTKGRKLMYIL
jgi:hypothetical protein